MASSSEISPAAFGGITRTPSIKDLTFISFCPPVIKPDTHIIALCGITDWRGTPTEILSSSEDEPESSKSGPVKKILVKGKDLLTRANPSKIKRQERKEAKLLKAHPHGNASPKNDGWFLSDFYLFYHLFQGLGAKQRCFTCENPEMLVARYGQYAYGEAAGDHRVVLDRNMLAGMRDTGNIHISSPRELLQDFINYFKVEYKAASERKQPILLVIFGHGDPHTHGIAIGGSGGPADAPRLELAYLEILMRPFNVSVTMLTTACFSGGWLIQPNLNISGLTVASNKTISYSWKPSLGQSYHSSIWATAVIESLIKMEDPKTTQFQSGTESVEIATLDPNVKSSTFAKLSEVISMTLTSEVDARDIHEISFAAQDDEWAMEWRQRSGIPLGTFQAQWDRLPRKPPQAISGQRPGKSGGIPEKMAGVGDVPMENDHGFRKTLTRRISRPPTLKMGSIGTKLTQPLRQCWLTRKHRSRHLRSEFDMIALLGTLRRPHSVR